MAHRSAPSGGAVTDVEDAIDRLRKRALGEFDVAYVDNVIVPYSLESTYVGETLSLPMIETQFTKENAFPTHLWGLLSDNWRPNPKDGVALALQGLERRGPDNRRKRAFMSAVTPDLYGPMYRDKIVRVFDTLLDGSNECRPLMRPYLEGFFDLYWDLHLGVAGTEIPESVRRFGMSFVTVLAYGDPLQKIVYENYMTVRALRAPVKRWIADRIADLITGQVPNPETTFVHYWITNGGGDDFRDDDVVFECIHNLAALSQWGIAIYNIMLKLAKGVGDPEVRDWFVRTMEDTGAEAPISAFTPRERFVMELFRTISPNLGSESVMHGTAAPHHQKHGHVVTPHPASSRDPRHWKDPGKFDPERYNRAPTSDQIDDAKCEQIGFARCPFDRTTFNVKDGRAVALHNSGFGTVYGVVAGKPMPVCDYAGYAPFGFGYRRCPGEQFTVNLIGDFLAKVWQGKVEFERLNVAKPETLPIGPSTVIRDDIGFVIPV